MSKKILQAAAGAAGGESVYVEDVFSTYLYKGDGTNPHTITNGVNLADEGGLVWTKPRVNGTIDNVLVDTERGTGWLVSNGTQAAAGTSTAYLSFNTDGYDIDNAFNNWNGTTIGDYVSWSFRKQAGFFDVVTWTGDGTNDREISHNLGSVPGFIIIKSTSNSTDWITYHRSYTYPQWIRLNSTDAQSTTYGSAWSSSNPPTSTAFTLGSGGFGDVNYSGRTYVAYIFAHDDQSFGDNSDESIIKCGSYTGNGSTTGPEINLGWEPQWLLIKNIDDVRDWIILDSMRGIVTGGNDERLYPNSSTSESGDTLLDLTSTGFQLTYTGDQVNGSGENYIYIAIRRPMKTPESGTDVFNSDYQGNGTTDPAYVSGFVTDFGIRYFTPGGSSAYPITGSRLTGTNRLTTSSTAAQVSQSSLTWDYMNGWYNPDSASSTVFAHMFKRATGFFDVVAYSGTSTIRQQAHNLGVTPEFVIVRGRDFASHWYTYHTGQTGGVDALHSTMRLNLTEASFDTQLWKNYDFNASTFSLDADNGVNGSAYDYIAYLFATLDGVSKVGSYTGTGSNVDVDCGFSAGARFILIKRTDSTGDWYVWDSERGIVAGNDPYLLLNSTAAEVTTTDYIDPLSSGFTVTSSAPAALNTSGGTYIFLAIA